MIDEIIEKARSVDLDRLEEEIEEEANRLARKKYQVLDRCQFYYGGCGLDMSKVHRCHRSGHYYLLH